MKKASAYLWVFSAIIFLICSCDNCSTNSNGAKAPVIQDSSIYTKQNYSELILDSCYVNEYLKKDKSAKEFAPDIFSFYGRRGYQSAWFVNGRLSNSASNFMSMLRDYQENFEDSSLRLNEIQSLIAFQDMDSNYFERNHEAKLLLEMKLTTTFFKYAKKAYSGTDKNPKDLEWFIPRKKKSYEMLIDSLVAEPKIYDKYEPVNELYKHLKVALVNYRSIEKKGGFPIVKMKEKKLSLNDSADAIADLKKYLKVSGDYNSDDTSFHYTTDLQTAVIRFQKRMGLTPDGIIGASMLRELNIPIAGRIKQIMLNMERLRWMPDVMPENYFMVNIPEFRLHIFEQGKYAWSSDVVVGKAATSTVIFTGMMSMVVFSPYWNVPPSIIKNELLPILRRNRNYLKKANMQAVSGNTILNPSRIRWWRYNNAVPFTIRQMPGSENSLGLVKFLFPNSYNIYLHDTPAKSLFGQTNRAFSHGCIRVAEAGRLANYIFRSDTVYTVEKIDSLMNSGVEKTVNLKTPIPVFICYFTAWVNQDGMLNFRKDIYGHDEKLAKEIFVN